MVDAHILQYFVVKQALNINQQETEKKKNSQQEQLF